MFSRNVESQLLYTFNRVLYGGFKPAITIYFTLHYQSNCIYPESENRPTSEPALHLL